LKKFSEVNLVLSGGAAKGIAHIGVLKALEEIGVKVKRISGASAGAIVSTFYSAGYSPDEMLSLLKEINWFKLFRFKAPIYGLIGWDKAYKFLESKLGDLKIEELQIPAYICATDLYTGRPIYFNQGELIPILLGSCSIPGIFQPVKYKDFLLVDGGIVNNLPVEPFQNTQEPTICVDVLPISEDRNIKNVVHILLRSFFLAVRSSSEKRKEFCNLVIVPDLREFSSFDVKKAQRIVQRGYEKTLETFNWFELL